MYSRKLTLPPAGQETFFLWGSRGVGKSMLLRTAYPKAFTIDLLKSENFRRYTANPETLRFELDRPEAPRFVVIDEIQKVPALLDEVHWLIENRGVAFALCGSSARKLKRGHANLLGGRALRYVLHGLVSAEIGESFDLLRALNHGILPSHYSSEKPLRAINSYIADYLKEEVAAEGLIRNLPAFAQFLNVAALSDAEVVNFSGVASDCGVKSPTAKGYFEILADTLLGTFLYPFRSQKKRKTVQSPKFYFHNVGLVNVLARRGRLELGGELTGKALENFIFHELTSFSDYNEKNAMFSFWHIPRQAEVDFIINDMEIVIEVKATRRPSPQHLKSLREIAKDFPRLKRRILVCCDDRRWRSEDRIDVIPVSDFLKDLWAGGIF